jgi:hypothetical protein
MFKATKNGAGNYVYNFSDAVSGGVDTEFLGGGDLVEIEVFSDTGCAVLTKEQAIAIANLILQQTK